MTILPELLINSVVAPTHTLFGATYTLAGALQKYIYKALAKLVSPVTCVSRGKNSRESMSSVPIID